jgi:DNA-binding transcriptional ArsR family regulator
MIISKIILRNQLVTYIFVVILRNKMRRDVFQAIADPTRREIINLITHRSLNLNAVAENFSVSRPAISKHIKILTECGLVVIKQKGRDRYCEAKLDKLKEVSHWVEQYKKFWNEKLDALEIYLEELQKEESKTIKRKKHGKRK